MRFLSCDWGTSSFRLRLVENGSLIDALETDCGVKHIDSKFEEYLAAQIAQLKVTSEVPVVASGMVTSSIGWHELPYAPTPIALDGHNLVTATKVLADGRTVHLISGVCTKYDVMRGEETQIVGAMAQCEKELLQSCVVVLPGTHSKHAVIKDSLLVDFKTFMTGELCELLWKHSVLRHSLPKTPPDEITVDKAFDHGVAASDDTGLLNALFRIRACDLLHGGTPEERLNDLLGIVVGTEWRSLQRTYPRGPVFLLAGHRWRACYHRAAQLMGDASRLVIPSSDDVDSALIAGHEFLLRKAIADL